MRLVVNYLTLVRVIDFVMKTKSKIKKNSLKLDDFSEARSRTIDSDLVEIRNEFDTILLSR